MKSDDSYRETASPCKIVSKYFFDHLVMDESSEEVKKNKQSTSKKPQAKADKIQKKSSKRAKGQKDIRTLVKSKKNELLKYSKEFDLICKQSGIDVDPEQLQLAIALSKSLEDSKSTDNPQITTTDKALSCNQRRNKIRTTLQEYGFQTKTAPAPTKKVKRYRKNYKLILATDTEKQQKIADRYAEILITNVALAKVNEIIGLKNNCVDSYLYNLTTNYSYDCIKNDDIFYISDLVPKSLHEKHNLKDWSDIPGRPVSPKLEELKHSFKDIECSQDELDIILSGSIDSAHDIVKSNHTRNSLTTRSQKVSPINENRLMETEFTSNPAVFYQNKSIEDKPISYIQSISNKSTETMSLPINRSCSPDLFDDEVTIIMDSSKDNILMQEGVSSVTVIKQNDFMELTNCIGTVNGDNTVSKNIACFSQGSKTRISANDFMDLTECIPACSQKKIHTSQSSSSYEKPKENFTVIKENNRPDVIDLNQSLNGFEAGEIDEKSLDDTIIMIDDDYSSVKTGNKVNSTNITSKDCLIIDVIDNQCENSRILNRNQSQHIKSTVDLDGGHNQTNITETIPDLVNFNRQENSQRVKDIEQEENFGIVDLTQSNFEKRLSQVNVTCLESTSERPAVFDGITNNPIHSENSNCNINSKDKHDISEKCKDFVEMDLTQSSSSGDCLHEHSANTKTSDDTIIINNEYDNSVNLINNDLRNKDNIITSDDIYCENDCEFDNLVKSVSTSKYNTSALCGEKFLSDNSFNLLHPSTVESATSSASSQNIDLTQDDDNGVINIEEDCEKTEKWDNKSSTDHGCHYDEFNNQNYDEPNEINKSLPGEDNNESNNQCESLSNGEDTQNSNIDLTQQSDDSVDTYRSPKLNEMPCDLGQLNNISIDYDELYDNDNITENCGRTSTSNSNRYKESDENGCKDDNVCGSSQQSEVFELSDNEFNYSVNRHVQDNSSSTSKQAKFDIGGLSIINDFLNRNSIPNRSNLRCSCGSNIEPNDKDNNDQSCLPVHNTENIDCNVNKESKSCEEITFVKISTPLRSKSDDNLLIAKTPRHDDYVIKTDQVTPMPNYETMTSPERNEELDKFGIKPLKRKRAIRILTHIYNQTHPLMEVLPDECSSPSKIRRTNNTESFPRRAIVSQIDSLIAKHSVQTTESSDPVDIFEPLSQNTSEFRKRKSSESSSSKENIFYEETKSVPDIRNIECSPEDWVFQKREKAKVHSCRVPLHIAFHNYVSCRKALREAILRYEPINIDDIHKGLVAIGYRYNPKDLLKFMDRKCITVKTADTSKKHKNP